MDYKEDATGQNDHEDTDHKGKSAFNRIGGALVMLELVIIILRFLDVTSWPWLLVLAPIWVPFVIVSVIAILYGMLSAFMEK